MAAPLVRTEALTRRFDDRLAVDALSFELAKGRVLALLGPNGAGKTTTMRMLSGLLAPSSGSATVCGHPLGQRDADNDAIRACCGVVPEAPGFYERLSARQNLRFFGGLQGLDDAEVIARSEAELARFRLAERGDERVGTYSKGMKQRLALARALLHRPALLFLDEPTAGLDPKATQELHALIRALRDGGVGIVLSTHTLEEAEALADEVLVLDTRAVFHGPPQRLGADAAPELMLRTRMPLPDDLALPAGCSVLAREDRQARIGIGDAEGDTPALVATLVAAGVHILEVRPVSRSLRDRYLDLLARR
ncbi:MAG: ABC transporter ATP-binding protein [Xanthomonadales bacterium]|nr:Vitamin B12 import ATP-binding protein BtuD [Xanthomonadales bacterium]MCC6593344.1 ABC transporter ATP-binding protein [Xanthomonadales bacterium]MCE7930419.1 ABC transporter ATP-binding protein [Xanthomonadales bacterium PRO6]